MATAMHVSCIQAICTCALVLSMRMKHAHWHTVIIPASVLPNAKCVTMQKYHCWH